MLHKVIAMSAGIVLASGSETRRKLLEDAGVNLRVRRVSVEEAKIRAALLATDAQPRDVADALAEAKARKASLAEPHALVVGCDQILAARHGILSKPDSKQEALAQLSQLAGQRHDLFSAVVICCEGQPIWRTEGHVRLYMRSATQAYLGDYIDRNWDRIQNAVGGYRLEEEGVRLFHRIEGDYFSVLGLPLVEVLNFLTAKGAIAG